jgi:regulator of sigma E protease
MLTLIAGIVMLGILVFVHELGHFCVAKLAGVKILKFSLGFGPRLVSRQWGETEYMICAIPLGGYVQMLGEGGGEGGEGAELTPEERRRSFADKPVLHRTAIVAAGPLMNLLLPFLILPVAYMVGVNLPAFLERPPCVGHVAAGSEGAAAGFQAGDCILAINDEQVGDWTDTSRTLISHAGSPLVFTLSRQGETLQVTLTPADGGIEGLQSFGLLPQQEALVGAISPGMPAAAAGLQAQLHFSRSLHPAPRRWPAGQKERQERSGDQPRPDLFLPTAPPAGQSALFFFRRPQSPPGPRPPGRRVP